MQAGEIRHLNDPCSGPNVAHRKGGPGHPNVSRNPNSHRNLIATPIRWNPTNECRFLGFKLLLLVDVGIQPLARRLVFKPESQIALQALELGADVANFRFPH